METDRTRVRTVDEPPPQGAPSLQDGDGAVPMVPVEGASPHTDVAVPVTPIETEEHRTGGLTPVTLLLTIFLAYLIFKVQLVIILLVAGILLATAIYRPVEYLHRHRGLGRGAATLLMYLVIIVGFGLVAYLLVPPVASQGTRFAADFPELLTGWRAELLESDNPLVRATFGRLFEVIDATVGSGGTAPTGLAFGVVQNIAGSLVTLFSIFLITFYWINEKPLVKRAVAGLFRPSQRPRVLHLWDEVEGTLGSWIRGQLILMAVIGVIATIAYSPLALDLPFWLILGVIAGLTEAIPNVGPILGAIPAVLLALTQDWKVVLFVITFVLLLQMLENAVLVPRIMRGTVGLSPLTIILAILAGSEYRGVAGALLAIPVAGAIQVILADLLEEKHRREAAERRQGGLRGRWGRFRLFRSRDLRVGEAPAAPAGATESFQAVNHWQAQGDRQRQDDDDAAHERDRQWRADEAGGEPR